MNETKVQASLSRIVAGINTEFDAMDDTDRGTCWRTSRSACSAPASAT